MLGNFWIARAVFLCVMKPLAVCSLVFVSCTVYAGEPPSSIVHVYDESHWLVHPRHERLAAIFHPSSDARPLEIVPAGSADASADEQPFLRAQRARGVMLPRLPVDGVWYVAQASDGYHLRENGYGDFAWDLVRIDDHGRQSCGSGTTNSDYYAWDEPVTLPFDGVVTSIIRDQPDGNVGCYTYGAGNAVFVRMQGRFIVAFLHLRHGSIPESIEPGAKLASGALLGRVGNSGTQFPHLHISLLYDDINRTGRTWGIPVEFATLWVKPTQGSPAQASYARPARGTLVSNASFRWGHQPVRGWDSLHR